VNVENTGVVKGRGGLIVVGSLLITWMGDQEGYEIAAKDLRKFTGLARDVLRKHLSGLVPEEVLSGPNVLLELYFRERDRDGVVCEISTPLPADADWIKDVVGSMNEVGVTELYISRAHTAG
jgi:hypothetical protein